MLCERKDCTGCFACQNICPKKCIDFIPDDKGHVYPYINKDICINCGLCSKVCPSLNAVEQKYPITAFASWALNDTERKTSTSGGVASVFSRKVLKNNGVVFGASIGNGLIVKHIMIEKESDLYKLKGSKYVHSYIENSFSLAKEKLDLGIKVLFIGTPCQIAGLRKYLRKEYSNLLTVDIICHGVPSQQMLHEEAKGLDVDRFTFRDENGYNMQFYKGTKSISCKPMPKSFYLSAFMKGITCRESCHTCSYANEKRVSDITIGDFWGLGELKNASKEVQKGISVILPITEKGLSFVNTCSNDLFLEERAVEEAVQGNGQLKHPSKSDQGRDIFNQLYPNNTFEFSVKKATKYYSIKNIIIRRIYANPKLLDSLRSVKRKVLK